MGDMESATHVLIILSGCLVER